MAEYLQEGQALIDGEEVADPMHDETPYTFMVISLAWLMLAALAIGTNRIFLFTHLEKCHVLTSTDIIVPFQQALSLSRSCASPASASISAVMILTKMLI